MNLIGAPCDLKCGGFYGAYESKDGWVCNGCGHFLSSQLAEYDDATRQAMLRLAGERARKRYVLYGGHPGARDMVDIINGGGVMNYDDQNENALPRGMSAPGGAKIGMLDHVTAGLSDAVDRGWITQEEAQAELRAMLPVTAAADQRAEYKKTRIVELRKELEELES